MSYLIYINGNLVELNNNVSFTQTKQVNDIANITNRNSNFTQTIKAPRTANNRKIFEGAFNVGSTADIPYQRAVCNVIDTNSGQHLIYNGWAVLIESTKDTYNFTVYDGIIDFYKKIEKLTINDLGVSELNHIKNLETVIQTWNEDLPYRYILADYNGKNLTDTSEINIDYQVPCASVVYLWNKIFDFIGFEYEGNIFVNEQFKNLWISYPKPTPITNPNLLEVTQQNSILQVTQIVYNLPFDFVYYGSFTKAVFIPDTNAYNDDYYTTTGGVEISGIYRFSFTPGTFTIFSSGAFSTSDLEIKVTATDTTFIIYEVNIQNGNYIDIQLNEGDKFEISLPLGFIAGDSPTQTTILEASSVVTTNVSLIDGYSLGFDEAFIDYKVTDFIKEIVIRFGLTLYKDKYTDKIKFLTLYEVLQTNNIVNLSNKFVQKVSEKYIFGNYAKLNSFKYKYNDEFMKHNDGFIKINNENLPAEITLFQSNIFSPERIKSSLFNGSNVYKIWDKEVNDEGEIEYKDLDNRFYFLRADRINTGVTIGSSTFGGEETSTIYYRESFFKLDFKSLLSYWYAPITSLFTKSRVIQCDFNLKELDIFNFQFDSLIYIEQLASYYLLNKIQKTEGKQARLELIEVDYFTKGIDNGLENYQITIGIPIIDECELTIPVATNYPLPTPVKLIVYTLSTVAGGGTIWVELNLTPPITQTLEGTTVVFDLTQLPYNEDGYRFALSITTGNIFNTTTSNISEILTSGGGCFVAPIITELEITNVTFIETNSLTSTYSIAFDSDVTLPVQCMVKYFVPQNGFFGGWSEYQQIYLTTNPFNFVTGVIFGSPTKFQIKIGDVESAIFDL
jgi:hypothetical protein